MEKENQCDSGDFYSQGLSEWLRPIVVKYKKFGLV